MFHGTSKQMRHQHCVPSVNLMPQMTMPHGRDIFKSTMARGMMALVVGALFFHTVTAIAPPHVNFTDWEPAPVRRRRLGIPFDYTPRHLSVEHCRYLTVEQCRQQDEAVRQAKADRRLISTGIIKVMVVLVQFTDHGDRNLPSRDYFDELFNGQGTSDVNPVGSVREWFLANSNGRYDVTFDVQDWKVAAGDEASYANGEYGLRGGEIMQEMFKPMMDEIANSGYDFTPMDTDNWGDLDQFFVIHSGYPAEHGNPSDGCTNSPENRIWSQGHGETSNGWTSPDGIYSVSSFAMTGAFDEGLCQEKPVEMGVIVHEIGHLFGLPELYDEDYEEAPIPLGGVGRFSIMSNTFGWTRNMKIPGHFDPWSKVEVKWLEPIEITENGFYPIQPSEISSQVYVIKQGFPEGEMLYIENRQPMKWDSDWEAGGILIYKVDDARDSQKTRGFPGHPNWPTDRYKVTLLQADGLWEIETGENPGNAGDFWTNGQKLSPGGEYPNTDHFSTGSQQPTGITIEIMTESQFIMLFQVSGL